MGCRAFTCTILASLTLIPGSILYEGVLHMANIKGLSHVVLYVNDLEKMAAFYRDFLGLVRYREHAGRMIFMTPDPEIEDHQLALAKGREGQAKIIAHIAWRVDTPA